MKFNKKDSVADAVQSILHQEEKKDDSLNAKLIKTVAGDDAEETPARKSIKAHGGPVPQPKVGVTKYHKESVTLKGFKTRYEEHSIFEQMVNEVLSKDASAGQWIHDFVHSDNPKFAGKSKEQRKKQALAAYYAKQRNEEVEQVEEGLGDTLKKAAKKVGEVLGGPDDEGHKKDLQKKMGIPQTGKPGHAKQNEEVESIDEKINPKKKTMDTLGGRVEVPAETHNQHTETKVELNSEGWDDMLKDVKSKKGPQPSGGSGVKQGTRYGGGKQKDKPEQDVDKKKVTESKRPESDDVPFAPPYNTTSGTEVVDKSGAQHTPMSRAKHLARLAMGRVKKDLGTKKGK